MPFLLDTDIFINHLRGAKKIAPKKPQDISYSIITRCELFAGRHTQEDIVNYLLLPYQELPLNRAIAELAGKLRRHTSLHTPDALIAATALYHDYTLISRNVRDYVKIPKLKFSSEVKD